MISRCTLQR